LKGAEPMKYQIVEREAFQVIGVKREFTLRNEVNSAGIPKMWKEMHENGIDDFLFQLNNGEIEGVLGVCVDKSDTKPNLIDYWVATEYNSEVPEKFLSLTIPASKWAVFEVHGPMPDAMTKTWKKIFSEWFPSSGYEYTGAPELEVYTDDDPSNPNLYSEIWIPIK
jgi:AraC family transcriptional regulator